MNEILISMLVGLVIFLPASIYLFNKVMAQNTELQKVRVRVDEEYPNRRL